MGKISVNIINELYNPIDAINRFINLTLQNMDEESENRQFLLESKTGIRKALNLVRRLNGYAKKLEKEIVEVFENNG